MGETDGNEDAINKAESDADAGLLGSAVRLSFFFLSCVFIGLCFLA